ncbi:uncharacterized protein LOC110910351 [Helianthus annuus]|uniref:uncharacterized protein LOC110910351 n=1 Tax=Helianthus annuus TaxID=4232 RepID=UPI000B900E37|nr:uncharacterized protein LOC110910351 [Helianthus annuus]
MEVECMRSCMRKLSIWYTPNFKPIITHDELDKILSTFGFTAAASTTPGWKEYSFSAAGTFLAKSPSPPPRPRLPYPRIDGLHVTTYRSFLDSVNFYLRMNNISDLFHVRGVPLHHAHDRSHKWSRMVKDDLVYVYREGTMDMSATCKNSNKDPKYKEGAMDMSEKWKNANEDEDPASIIVPWKNIMNRII